MLRSFAAVAVLAAVGAPAFSGEFFTGTRSSSNRSERTRTSVGNESLTAIRNFKNVVSGSAQKHYVSVAASAENARAGQRNFGFIEGESSADIEGQGAGSGLFGGAGGAGLFPFSAGAVVGGIGNVAASGQVGSEIDGMAGTGSERFLDGSLQASAEWGRANSNFRLSENGSSTYKMRADFTEIENTDGTSSSGGSVFSFN